MSRTFTRSFLVVAVLTASIACAGLPGADMSDPLTIMRHMHAEPLLGIGPGGEFLAPLPPQAKTTGPSHRTLGSYPARRGAEPIAATLGGVRVQALERAYGDTRSGARRVEGELDASHVLLQLAGDISGADCERLRDNLEASYGAPSARLGGYAITWSYKITTQKGRGTPGSCQLWVAFEPPRVDPLDRKFSARLTLDDEVRTAWLRAWQEAMHRALTGETFGTVQAFCQKQGFDDRHTKMLLDQISIAYSKAGR